MFDEVVIAIGVNALKRPMFTVEERTAMLESLFANEPRVKVMSYSPKAVVRSMSSRLKQARN
jgi:pantetheine-phosphate adenylyltransferase